MRSYDSNSPSEACFDASNGSPSGWRSVKEKIKISAKADKILLIYISLFFIN